jgi:hypothetical protein
VHFTLQQQLYLYQIQTLHELVAHNTLARRAFCHWILQQLASETTLTAKILLTDKLCFTRAGIINIHNEHIWSDQNSQVILSHHHHHHHHHHQQHFSINLFAGILGDCLMGSHILPAQDGDHNYLNFLQMH